MHQGDRVVPACSHLLAHTDLGSWELQYEPNHWDWPTESEGEEEEDAGGEGAEGIAPAAGARGAADGAVVGEEDEDLQEVDEDQPAG